MSSVGIFIPCYRCGPQVLRVLEEIRSSPELILVPIFILDNHSESEHVDMIQKDLLVRQDLLIQFVQNPTNFGLGGSFKKAFNLLKDRGFEWMLMIHGDNQASIKDFIPIIHQAQKGQLEEDFVFGSRFMSGAKRSNYSLRRLIANKVLNGLASLAWGKNIEDLGSGLNLYRLSALAQKDLVLLPDQIHFDLVLLKTVIQKKMKFRFAPISWKSADEISTISEWKVGWDVLKVILGR